MTRRALLALAAVAAALAGCGGSQTSPAGQDGAATTTAGTTSRAVGLGSSSTTDGGPADVATETTGGRFKGGTVSPVVAAPELGLRTYDGRPVRLADYRGRAVLVTFVYTRCPDICPLIVDNLVRVTTGLGPDAKRLRVVAVSVDPAGDTPAAVKRFLTAHRALGKVDYLVGSRKQLEAVWARWGIAARTSKDNPELIEHSGVIWGVDPQGRRVTFYPAVGFDAADIEGDVRQMLHLS